jgi:Cupin-like domain
MTSNYIGNDFCDATQKVTSTTVKKQLCGLALLTMASLLHDFINLRFLVLAVGLVAYILWVVVLVICAVQYNDNKDQDRSDDVAMPRPLALYAWSMGQWCYWISPRISELLTQNAWRSLEKHTITASKSSNNNLLLEIPTISVQDFVGNETGAVQFLQSKYGKNWRERPLLLKGLWDPATLNDASQPPRQLSPQGLLQMNLTIPYYQDARTYGALQPDAQAPVQEIVQRMLQGHPHKIGSQFIVQHQPHLLDEVAPLSLVTALFGDYFSVDRLLGHGKTLGIFPGITTVPLFVANGNATTITTPEKAETIHSESDDDESCPSNNLDDAPSTGLHCEPIANVAVQLHGFRQWTLVDPQYSWQLRPALSRDGRSFYPSWVTSLEHVPRYQVITYPGDAVFVPTWTWHRVDYLKESADLSIGASLFHFRAGDYLRRNPLFAMLLVPALIGELAGTSTQ